MDRVFGLARRSVRNPTRMSILSAASQALARPASKSARWGRPSSSLATRPSVPRSTHPIRPEHAVISTFDLFSIGIGPSSSHTVGPMRAARIFLSSIPTQLSAHLHSLKISLHGSLAATGMGHMTPHAVLLGLTGEDPETVAVGRLGVILDEIKSVKEIELGLADGMRKRVKLDFDRDVSWHLNPLPQHPNGLVFTLFNEEGDIVATNQYFSVGGGFVVNQDTQTAENLYYKDLDPAAASPSRRNQSHNADSGTLSPTFAKLPPPPSDGVEPEKPLSRRGHTQITPTQPPYLFDTARSLYQLCVSENLSIAQLVWENELAFRSASEVRAGLLSIWNTMDECIRNGVTSTEQILPGGLQVKRRAPSLYRRMQTPTATRSSTDTIRSLEPVATATQIGRADHSLGLVPKRSSSVFPDIEYLSCMAIAVNEVNASGGRVVTAPTNGAAGVIPATLKYVVEFISQAPERDIMTFLLTASAIGMLFKRGATISAAEGGCMAEVGVACSMAAAGISACLGAEPAVVLQAAEIGIEHNLGLTCDPLGGLVQIPCIERNSLGAVKAVTAIATTGQHTVSLDDAIEACRSTALDMHSHYKETSLAGLATAVKIPLSSPAC